MKTIAEIVSDHLDIQTGAGIKRICYTPYRLGFALQVIERIAKGFEPKFQFTKEAMALYTELIYYFHADSKFNGNLEKGILIHGPTGSGKTLAMKVMSIYQKIDNIRYFKDNKIYTMNFDVIQINKMVEDFIENAFDGIYIYANRYVLCMDDIGIEIDKVKYYGNELDVIGYIISERQSKRLLTFATSNLTLMNIEDKYGDRIFSRMSALFNFIILKDIDFRRK